MNERIKALGRQASNLALEEYRTRQKTEFVGDVIYSDIYDQKFAELIVQECIKEIEEFTIMSEDYVQWNQALSHVALYLKDHFGIDQ